MLLRIESHSPLHDISESEWKEVVVVLRGTLLTFYRARKDGTAGKLLRSYTLQHAEIGLASDTQYAILVPQSRIAHFLPAAAWRKAWRTDPALFKSEEQSLLRLRVETDQILVAHPEEETIQEFTYALAAAIDIAMDLDERSIPKQCTVPRRRNRQQRTLEAVASILENPSVLAQQERIMRELYPQLASSTSETDQSQPAQNESTAVRPPSPASQPAAHEDEEIDLSAMHEESSAESSSEPASVEAGSPPAIIDMSRRPSVFRQATTLTIDSMDSTFSAEMFYETPPTNFGADGKWSPPHNRSPAQIQRYIQRCMPILLADAPRASDVLIQAGRRVKINWKTAMLEDWTLLPPSYRSHRFDPMATTASTSATAATNLVRNATGLTRTPSQTSSAANSASEAGSDEIALVNAAAAGADLTLTSTTDKSSSSKPSPRSRKTRHGSTNSASTATTQSSQLNLHSAIYCF
jgi:hypothetical protein